MFHSSLDLVIIYKFLPASWKLLGKINNINSYCLFNAYYV